MSSYCRLCLNNGRTFTDAFEVQEGKTFAELIELLFMIEILPNDKHSKNICDECLEVVVNAYQLRQTSIANQKHLPFQQEIELTAIKCEKEETFAPPQQVKFTAIENEIEDRIKSESESSTNQLDDQSTENFEEINIEQYQLEVQTTVVKAEEEDVETDLDENKSPSDFLQVKLEEGEEEEVGEEGEDDDVIIETHEKMSLRPNRPRAVIPKSMKNKNVTYACPRCAETFRTHCTFVTHFNRSHDNAKRPHKCRFCNNQFSRNTELQQHTLIHEMDALASTLYERGEEDYFRSCLVCSETFLKLTELKDHWDKYHDRTKNPFSCAYCHACKKNEKLILAHILTKHRSLSKDGRVVIIRDVNSKTVKVSNQKMAIFINPIDAHKHSEDEDRIIITALNRIEREKKAALENARLSHSSKSSSSKGQVSKAKSQAKRHYPTKYSSSQGSSVKRRCLSLPNSEIGSFQGVITIDCDDDDDDDDDPVIWLENNEDPYINE